MHAADPTFDAALSGLSMTGALVMLGAGVLFEETTLRGYALLTLKERSGTPGAVLVTSWFTLSSALGTFPKTCPRCVSTGVTPCRPCA